MRGPTLVDDQTANWLRILVTKTTIHIVAQKFLPLYILISNILHSSTYQLRDYTTTPTSLSFPGVFSLTSFYIP
jgi:hypothetical protein